jgi:hypothetical protein
MTVFLVVKLHKELMDKLEFGTVNLECPYILVCCIESGNRNDLSNNFSNASLITASVGSPKKK